MADDRIDAYADALFGVAAAEGRLDDVEDELFRSPVFSKAPTSCGPP
jgi:F0F1-type ATP synthase delta subunit